MAESQSENIPPEWMVVSAVRYALGRKTYIVSQTVDYVISIVDELRPQTLDVIERDINEYKERSDLGMSMDAMEWTLLLTAIKEAKK